MSYTSSNFKSLFSISFLLTICLLTQPQILGAKQSLPEEVSKSDTDIRVDKELGQETIELKPAFLTEEEKADLWSQTKKSMEYLGQSNMLNPSQLSGDESQLDYRSILESLGYDAEKSAQLNEVIKTLVRAHSGRMSDWDDPAARDRLLAEAGLSLPDAEAVETDEAASIAVEAAQSAQRTDLEHADEAVKEKKISTTTSRLTNQSSETQ